MKETLFSNTEFEDAVSPSVTVKQPSQWLRLLLGLVVVFGLFQWTANELGSDRGEAGLIVGAVVVLATIVVERVLFGQRVLAAARSLGLGWPAAPGLIVGGIVSLMLLFVIPTYAGLTGASISLWPRWEMLAPGLFAQAGIAEETLFRGYLFRHVRYGRSFWRASGLSMLPFVAVHLLMFGTMPWPVALAAVLLAVVLSFPLARLFELGGNTIWAPALLHFIIQGAVKVVVVSDGANSRFPLLWIGASALLPLLILFIPRPRRMSDKPSL